MVPQNSLLHAHKLKLRWFVTLSTLPLLGVVTAFGIMPQNEVLSLTQKTLHEAITLPNLQPLAPATATFWRTERMQRGDTVADLLQRLNVDDAAASKFLRTSSSTERLRRLNVGTELQAETDADGALLTLSFLGNNTEQILIERSGSTFKVRTLPAQTEQRIQIRTGEISSTLYAAADDVDLPDTVANQLADIFGGDVDFHRDLRKGDKFTVIYETTYINGDAARTGRILAAEFVNNTHPYRAVYFQTGKDSGDYYAPDGKSMHKAFLRSPLEFSRVSSGFTKSRFHPVLNKWRSHKGVDYAAHTGTKVKATSDGVVSFVGKRGGYGNVITIKHQGNVETVYGHLSRFAGNLRKGQRVNQGQLIGYVGMTGLASGPHLHYEFKVSGLHRDPLRVSLPEGKPINAAQMASFQAGSQELLERLSMLRNTRVASLN